MFDHGRAPAPEDLDSDHPKAPDTTLRRGWVMVVDDDRDLCSAMAETLEEAGWAVTTLRDGAQAMRFLQRCARAPDLILLDLRMPRQSGWDVLAALRRSPLLVQTPVVVVSADRSTPAGAVAWLRKPVTAPVLLETIESCARHR